MTTPHTFSTRFWVTPPGTVPAEEAIWDALTPEERRAAFRAKLEASEASGISDKTVDDIMREARARVRARRAAE